MSTDQGAAWEARAKALEDWASEANRQIVRQLHLFGIGAGVSAISILDLDGNCRTHILAMGLSDDAVKHTVVETASAVAQYAEVGNPRNPPIPPGTKPR